MKKRLDIILPAHNERGNIVPIYTEITEALEKTNYDYFIHNRTPNN